MKYLIRGEQTTVCPRDSVNDECEYKVGGGMYRSMSVPSSESLARKGRHLFSSFSIPPQKNLLMNQVASHLESLQCQLNRIDRGIKVQNDQLTEFDAQTAKLHHLLWEHRFDAVELIVETVNKHVYKHEISKALPDGLLLDRNNTWQHARQRVAGLISSQYLRYINHKILGNPDNAERFFHLTRSQHH